MRKQIQKRLDALRPMASVPSPHGGWIKNLRESLGMSLQQLADRVKMTPQSLQGIETAEREGRVTIATLKKIAVALDADVQVAIIPSKPLEQMIRDQAMKAASRIARNTQTHMALEDQATSEEFRRSQIEKIADALVGEGSRKIWDEQ